MTSDIQPDHRRQVPRTDRYQLRVVFGIFKVGDMLVVLANDGWIGRWFRSWRWRWILGLLLTVAAVLAKWGAI